MTFWNTIELYTQNQAKAVLCKLIEYAKSVKLPGIMHYMNTNDKY